MTREKFEIIKKLDEIDRCEDAELEMGCGFGAELIGDTFERMRWPLLKRLANDWQLFSTIQASKLCCTTIVATHILCSLRY